MKRKNFAVSMLLALLVMVGVGCGGGTDPVSTSDNDANNGADNNALLLVDGGEGTSAAIPGDADDTAGDVATDGDEVINDGSDEVDVADEDVVDDDDSLIADLDNDGVPDEEDTDADGDGSFASGDSDDDCDDRNPVIFPGAPDKPDYPDYTDSNCDGVDGDAASAYWVASDGDDNAEGTIFTPFRTIKHAVEAARADISAVKDVYVVKGRYVEEVSLTNGVGLYGGFGPLTGDNTRARKVDSYRTRLSSAMMLPLYIGPAMDPMMGQPISGNDEDSVVEGLTITGGNGSPAVAIVNSSPKIRHCELYSSSSAFFSAAVIVSAWAMMEDSAAARPFFYDNHIESADATDMNGGNSIAVLVNAGGENTVIEPTFEENVIVSGQGTNGSAGIILQSFGGAKAYLNATKNDISSDWAGTLSAGIILGHGFTEWEASQFTGANIEENNITGGRNAPTTYGIWVNNASDTVSITGNRINGGSALNDAIALLLGSGTATSVDGNTFFAERANRTIGVYESTATSTPVSFKDNTFDDGLSIKYHDFDDGDISDIDELNAMDDISDISGNVEEDCFTPQHGEFID